MTLRDRFYQLLELRRVLEEEKQPQSKAAPSKSGELEMMNVNSL